MFSTTAHAPASAAPNGHTTGVQGDLPQPRHRRRRPRQRPGHRHPRAGRAVVARDAPVHQHRGQEAPPCGMEMIEVSPPDDSGDITSLLGCRSHPRRSGRPRRRRQVRLPSAVRSVHGGLVGAALAAATSAFQTAIGMNPDCLLSWGGMTNGMTRDASPSASRARLACLALWGWQASNLRPGGYEPPALTD